MNIMVKPLLILAVFALLLVCPSAAIRPDIFSFDTVPVFFHSANSSGPWSDAAADRIAKFAMATFEKNMAFAAHNGPSEMNGPAACKQIKAINPQVATVYYLNSVIDWPFYSLHDKMVANPSWRLKNKQGDDLRVVGQYGFNFSITECREAWIADCVAATAGGCDGCFIDRSNDMTHLNNTKAGQMTAADAARFEQAHLDTLKELNTRLAALDKFAISNNEGRVSLGTTTMMIEDFAASGQCVETMLEAVAHNLTVQAHAGDLADEPPTAAGTRTVSPPSSNCAEGITNSLSAFLIAAGRYSYYHCATGWQSPAMWPAAHDDWLTWRPEYDRPLGEPVGLAVKTGDVWTRSFKTGTHVAFDGVKGNGTIVWSDGAVQTGRPWNPPPTNPGCKWQTQ